MARQFLSGGCTSGLFVFQWFAGWCRGYWGFRVCQEMKRSFIRQCSRAREKKDIIYTHMLRIRTYQYNNYYVTYRTLVKIILL